MTDYGDIALVRGMHYLAETQASIAHNLANSNSNGFKRQVGFAENATDQFGSILNKQLSTVQYESSTDWRNGSMTATGNDFDVGLEGTGFFMVQDNAGNKYYTRDGSMRLNTEGFLVNQDGKKFLDNTGIPIGFESFGESDLEKVKISPDGTIQASGSTVAQLGVFSPPNSNDLEAIGKSLFLGQDDVPPTANHTTKVRQGNLERSNVETLTELVSMISVQRGFEATGRVLSTLGRIKSAFVNTISR